MNYVAPCTRWYTLYHMVHSCKRKIARHPWSAASLARPLESPPLPLFFRQKDIAKHNAARNPHNRGFATSQSASQARQRSTGAVLGDLIGTFAGVATQNRLQTS